MCKLYTELLQASKSLLKTVQVYKLLIQAYQYKLSNKEVDSSKEFELVKKLQEANYRLEEMEAINEQLTETKFILQERIDTLSVELEGKSGVSKDDIINLKNELEQKIEENTKLVKENDSLKMEIKLLKAWK